MKKQKQNNIISDDVSKQNSGGIGIWNRLTQKNEERINTKENLSKERKNISKWILFYFFWITKGRVSYIQFWVSPIGTTSYYGNCEDLKMILL